MWKSVKAGQGVRVDAMAVEAHPDLGMAVVAAGRKDLEMAAVSVAAAGVMAQVVAVHSAVAALVTIHRAQEAAITASRVHDAMVDSVRATTRAVHLAAAVVAAIVSEVVAAAAHSVVAAALVEIPDSDHEAPVPVSKCLISIDR